MVDSGSLPGPTATSPTRVGGGSSIYVMNGIRAFGNPNHGAFKMNPEIFGFKDRKTNSVRQFKATEVEKADWIVTGPDMYQLRVTLNSDKKHEILRFDGFKAADFAGLNAHFEENFDLPIHKRKFTHRGWHWGEYSVHGDAFRFEIDGKPCLDLNASEIAQVAQPAKTDLTLEVVPDDPTGDAVEDQLLEVRFYMPPKGVADETEATLAELKQKLLVKSGAPEAGPKEGVCRIGNINIIVPGPRGRYEIDVSRKAFKMHGKSYDYTIQYSNIARMFLVERPNSPHMHFVVSLEQPLRQGQTSYPYIVFQFEKDEQDEVDVNINDDEVGKLSTQVGQTKVEIDKHMEGNLYEILVGLFQVMKGARAIVSDGFQNFNGDSAITATHRASSGHLYPLKKGFLYLIKPVMFVKYDEIVSAEFSRIGASSTNRYFSFSVSIRGGLSYEFTSIDRNEHKALVEWMNSKGIRIKNPQTEEATGRRSTIADADLPESEEEDEDFDEEEDEDFSGGSGGEANSSSDSEESDEDGKDGDNKQEKRGKKRKISKPDEN
eukprot:GHVT01009267.1.p1 GENE.GHVT01009267.1~~GHVT01009267.1.p1  ORF type:complete len:547 (-),score=62.90 GHVT01009267.1:888-2528(-)